jgi:predicted acylesterase/phospholipase RssA
MDCIIDCLVISGGGTVLFQWVGVLKELEASNRIMRTNIKTIYGTSAGAMTAVFYILHYDWDIMYKYLIHRPWQNMFPTTITEIIHNIYYEKGIITQSIFEKIFEPLIKGKNLSMEITMKEFYEWSNVDLHVMAYDLEEFQTVDISHETYPNMRLMQAIQMSSALPFLVSPVFYEGKCFIDGGMQYNYSLSKCLEKGNHEPRKILGMRNKYIQQSESQINQSEPTNPTNQINQNIKQDTTLVDYAMDIIKNVMQKFNTENKQETLENEIWCEKEYMSIDKWIECITNQDKRRELIEKGEQTVVKRAVNA